MFPAHFDSSVFHDLFRKRKVAGMSGETPDQYGEGLPTHVADQGLAAVAENARWMREQGGKPAKGAFEVLGALADAVMEKAAESAVPCPHLTSLRPMWIGVWAPERPACDQCADLGGEGWFWEMDSFERDTCRLCLAHGTGDVGLCTVSFGAVRLLLFACGRCQEHIGA